MSALGKRPPFEERNTSPKKEQRIGGPFESDAKAAKLTDLASAAEEGSKMFQTIS